MAATICRRAGFTRRPCSPFPSRSGTAARLRRTHSGRFPSRKPWPIVPDGARVYAAGACPALALAVREKGCVRIDPLADEAFVQANAAITAECAIGLAISQSESCLYDGACLVLATAVSGARWRCGCAGYARA